MSVHYKFKAALDFSTVTFDGIHISVADLKEAIIDQKKLAKNADFDLQIMNAQTNEVYEDASTLIPKNTSVTVARVPIDKKRGGGHGGTNSGPPGGHNRLHHRGGHHPSPILQPSAVAKGVDLTSMEGTEDEKIQAMMNQATADYDPSTYVRLRGRDTQYGRVPPSYRCYRCNQPGHWIKDCPQNNTDVSIEVKKSTGIPRSFMVAVDGPQVPGALITPEGRYAVPAVDHAAYLEKNKPKPKVEAPVPKPKIPDELLCNLCQDLLTDALLVPCCAVSYCDDCIRSALLESEEQECPGCHDKGISPTTLIPSRFLRTAVNAFKNETGYSKPPKLVEPPAPITVDLTDSNKKRSPRKLSLDELPDDLFPHSPRKIEVDTSNKKDLKDEPVDLYDFNDGSIPPVESGPPSANDENQTIRTIGGGPQKMSSMPHTFERNMYHRQPRPPFQGSMNPRQIPNQPPYQHQSKPSLLEREPPPPGFEMTPPGDENDDRRYRQGPPGPGGMDANAGPPNRHMMQNLPFDPNQPPPGFPGLPPQGIGMYGQGPPQGQMPPNAGYFPPQYRGPPPGSQMYGPPQRPDGRYYSERRRPPFAPRDDRDRPRMDRDKPRDREGRGDQGIIDDPLEEFNRLMREKDRRKQMATGSVLLGPPPKRSRSPSFSPTRRTPSPFLKARSRSRTYSRSPSPKRKRLVRRGSFSRSRSRSPLPLRRPVGRIRSPSPLRRSPRRAPPFTPSPPPSGLVRIPPRKHDKDDYYDSRSRYEPPRYPNKSYGRENRENEGRFEASKYDSNKYNKFDNIGSKHETAPTSKYDRHERQPTRSYHQTESRHYSHDKARSRDRDRENPKYFDSVAHGKGDHALSADVQMKPPTNVQAKPAIEEKPSHRSSSRTDSTTATETKSESRAKDRSTHEHHAKHSEPESTGESPKKSKKDKKKHKKKSRDEKDKKSKKKKSKSDKTDEKDDTEEDHSVTSGSRRDSIETQSIERQSPDQTNEKQIPRTEVCDSTVKSPVDTKAAITVPTNSVIKELVFDPMYKPGGEEQLILPVTTTDAPVEETRSLLPITSLDNALELLESKSDAPQIMIPPSKWDRDEDEIDQSLTKQELIEPGLPTNSANELNKINEKVVTSEVIKRAENALFSKGTYSVIGTDSSKISPKRKEDKSPEVAKEPEVKQDAKRKNSSIEIAVAKPDIVTDVQPVKLSVRDRLGSKVTDEGQYDKPLKSQIASKVYEPEKSTRRRSRSRSASRGERRRRSSSRGRERNPSRHHDDRESVRQKESYRRAGERPRSRSPIRLGPKPDRSRVDNRDRYRRPIDDRSSREVSRRHDDSTKTIERVVYSDKSRNDIKQRLERRSREPRRSPQRSSRSTNPDREPSSVKSSVVASKGVESVFESSQPSPPGLITITRTNQEENWKLSDKFVPIGFSEVAESTNKSYSPPASSESKKPGTPVPLAVRKQKGRINIKLSSSSKAEDAKSSSSSSDDDDEDEKESKSGKADSETDDKKKDKKRRKKKTKRRKSESTSSSSSDDEKSKKKRKAKKKKKKSKKKSK